MTTLESFTFFAVFASFVVLALTVAWVALEMLYVSAIDDEPPTAEFSPPPPVPECWIRCSDWEFIPARLDDVIDGREDILLPAQYASMRQMEYRDRMQRENADAQRDYQDFHSALCEPDEDEDDWMIDIGGEG